MIGSVCTSVCTPSPEEIEAAIAAVTKALAGCDDPAMAADLVRERAALRAELAEAKGGNVVALRGRR